MDFTANSGKSLYPTLFPAKPLKTKPRNEIYPPPPNLPYTPLVRTREISKTSETLECADIGRRGGARRAETH